MAPLIRAVVAFSRRVGASPIMYPFGAPSLALPLLPKPRERVQTVFLEFDRRKHFATQPPSRRRSLWLLLGFYYATIITLSIASPRCRTVCPIQRFEQVTTILFFRKSLITLRNFPVVTGRDTHGSECNFVSVSQMDSGRGDRLSSAA